MSNLPSSGEQQLETTANTDDNATESHGSVAKGLQGLLEDGLASD